LPAGRSNDWHWLSYDAQKAWILERACVFAPMLLGCRHYTTKDELWGHFLRGGAYEGRAFRFTCPYDPRGTEGEQAEDVAAEQAAAAAAVQQQEQRQQQQQAAAAAAAQQQQEQGAAQAAAEAAAAAGQQGTATEQAQAAA
jgi:hypothetical protein